MKTHLKKRFIFIRHGQTHENVEGKMHVHKEEEHGLNEKGKAQIESLAVALKENNVGAVFTSPEVRAVESAAIVSKQLGLPQPIVMKELIERNWGEWQGKPWHDVEDELETMTIEERYTFIPPGGESWKQMEKRLVRALETIMDNDAEDVAIVTHAGAIRGLMPILKDAPKEISFMYDFHNASATIFDYSYGIFTEVSVNDFAHLGKTVVRNLQSIDDQIKQAVTILNQGGIVIYPTDTAFGIGCRIDDEDAIKRLFTIRRRPETQATPVLVDSIAMARKYWQHIPHEVERDLLRQYWPGALTVILDCKKEKVPNLVRGGTETLGMRMPNNDTALALIKGLGIPLLGPSANFHGEATPYWFEALDEELIKLVDFVLPGECKVKLASTVVDCTVHPWNVIRQGAVQLANTDKLI